MILNKTYAEYLSLGSQLLGCGGGGNVQQGVNAYEAAFRIAEENGRQVEMISVEELKERHPDGGVIVTFPVWVLRPPLQHTHRRNIIRGCWNCWKSSCRSRKLSVLSPAKWAPPIPSNPSYRHPFWEFL